MYEIALGVDTDEDRARAQAEAIVDLPGEPEEVHATVLHAFGENPSGASVHQVGAVRRARDVLEDAGIEVSLDESSGDPATAIVDTAEEINADVICVAGRKRTPAGKVLFGSVTQGVILATDRSVLVCSPGSSDR
ncbi:universal stress protein [Halobacteriales archaeon QS_3_64_16]|nr:MAG: universal stress protein [Halobacteriales archaeon QS_3_64_16]